MCTFWALCVGRLGPEYLCRDLLREGGKTENEFYLFIHIKIDWNCMKDTDSIFYPVSCTKQFNISHKYTPMFWPSFREAPTVGNPPFWWSCESHMWNVEVMVVWEVTGRGCLIPIIGVLPVLGRGLCSLWYSSGGCSTQPWSSCSMSDTAMVFTIHGTNW